MGIDYYSQKRDEHGQFLQKCDDAARTAQLSLRCTEAERDAIRAAAAALGWTVTDYVIACTIKSNQQDAP